jgi:hypothetical protein
MYVIACGFEVAVAAALDQGRFEPPRKKMPKRLVSAVKTLGKGAQEPFHPGDQVGVGGLEHQVEMVSHQAVTVNLPAGFLAAFFQSGNEPVPVLVVAKDRFAMIPAIHHVVYGSGILDAQLAGHKASTDTLSTYSANSTTIMHPSQSQK